MTQTVYIDLETTGLDFNGDVITEIGMALVENYTVVDMFQSVVLTQTTLNHLRADSFSDFIKNMHGPDGSGLLSKLANVAADAPDAFDIRKVERRAIHKLASWNLGKVPTYGSSVHFDRGFLKVQMPTLDEMFHHRCVDSSSQMEFIKGADHLNHLVDAIYKDPSAADEGRHDVVSDIFYSIDLQRRLDKWVYSVADQARAITRESEEPIDILALIV